MKTNYIYDFSKIFDDVSEDESLSNLDVIRHRAHNVSSMFMAKQTRQTADGRGQGRRVRRSVDPETLKIMRGPQLPIHLAVRLAARLLFLPGQLSAKHCVNNTVFGARDAWKREILN